MKMKKKRNNPGVIFIAGVLLLAAVLFAADVWSAEEYKALGKRDPFVPLVGVGETGVGAGLAGIVTIDDVVFQGITTDPDGTRSIVINGEILREGQRVERIFVESIGDNEAVIMIDEEKYNLKLYE